MIDCLQIPESSLDIFEDVEPSPSDDEYAESLGQDTSPVNHDGQASHATSWYDDTAVSRCTSTASQRVSVYLLGDFESDDVDDTPTSPNTFSKSPPLNTRRGQGTAQRKQRRSEPSNVPTSPVLTADQTTGGASGSTSEPQRTPEVQLNSMDRAVGVVLSAKRFMVRFRSSVVVPCKPDTPVPPDMQPPDIQIHRTSVKEPIRFVYEGPMPYTRSTGLQLKPTMNHLRVPGRPPPNVPQTIIEEDPVLITPPTTPPSPGAGLEPPSPSTRRRKNASSWIAPPVIDVMEVDATHAKDMRVECPGVLVEHHN